MVALLAEGVDRNLRQVLYHGLQPLVALLAEGVDRNIMLLPCSSGRVRRPPRGGRG